ncbi:MAG: protease inhibitor I42 family protein [Bacteroidota bacterium]
MKHLLLLSLLAGLFLTTQAQKKVAAVVNLTINKVDSVVIEKGKSFVVQLPVHNRTGDDWKLSQPSVKCNFTQSMLGQAGMLPNQPEPKLFFFKAVEKGTESIRFIYKNPRTAEGIEPEEKLLIVTIQ